MGLYSKPYVSYIIADEVWKTKVFDRKEFFSCIMAGELYLDYGEASKCKTPIYVIQCNVMYCNTH